MEAPEEELRSLRRSVSSFLNGDGSARDGVFTALFALNNRIGPALRRTNDPLLRGLQLSVNELTVAMKGSDRRRVADAMEALEAAAASISGSWRA